MKNYTLEELLATPKARKIIEENLSSYHDEDEVFAVLEYWYWKWHKWRKSCYYVYTFEDLENAIQDIENDKYTIYSDIDSYHDSCDETLEFNWNDFIERYFDYDMFHRDCDFDVTEMSNWVVICNY